MSADDCEVCHHTHEGLPGMCPACGCKGFWPEGASRCANEECNGSHCADQRLRERENRPGISLSITVTPEAAEALFDIAPPTPKLET